MNYFKSIYMFILLFVIFISITLSILFYFKNIELSNFLTLQTQEAEYRYNGMSRFPKDTSDLIYHTLINTPAVINIFKNANSKDMLQQKLTRDKLYKYLLGSYKKLKNYNIGQLQFHLPNNNSFLRFHRPKKYGDDLTNVRQTVAYVNEFLVPVQGFEEGKIFNGYRFVYPLFDEDQKHLGSVEISHSINAFSTMYQRAFENFSLNIVLKKEVVQKKVFDDELKNYEPYILNHAFVNQKSMGITKHIKEIYHNIENIEFIQKKMNNFENFSISVPHKNHYDLVSFISIKNVVSKEKIAYAISFEKSEWLNYYNYEYIRQIIFNVILSFIIALGICLALRYYITIKKQAYEDGLIHIYNRSFFEQYLTQKYMDFDREELNLSLIMIDIDHFKKINDTFGHKVGDDALKYLADVVNNYIRKSDVFGRWGGEEFMILIEGDLETAQKIAENLRKKIDNLTENEVNIPHFTCSFGIISLSNEISLEESYVLVDERLYKAKESGRNKVVSR